MEVQIFRISSVVGVFFSDLCKLLCSVGINFKRSFSVVFKFQSSKLKTQARIVSALKNGSGGFRFPKLEDFFFYN